MQYFIFSDATEKDFRTHDDAKSYAKNCHTKIVHCYASFTPKIRYKYSFDDGKVLELNEIQAKITCLINGSKIVSGGPLRYQTKDMYEGYNHAFGKYVSGRTEHKEILKQTGGIEIGNEKLPTVDRRSGEYVSDSELKTIIGDMGANISGCEAEAIKRGVALHVPE